jgi:hypothetical protein
VPVAAALAVMLDEYRLERKRSSLARVSSQPGKA